MSKLRFNWEAALRRLGIRLVHLVAFVGCLALPGMAQSLSAQVQVTQAGSNPTEPAVTLKTYTRMVTLELVAKDSKGNHVTGLKPEDFQLFEQTRSESKVKRPQKIASFREVNFASQAKRAAPVPPAQPGVYSNTVSLERADVPPTILLVDGLNTDIRYQAQVHMQMLKMLQQLPGNVPVAVFLLGSRLVMLQSFTTDPQLTQAALRKAVSAAGQGMATLDPRDNPNEPQRPVGSITPPQGAALNKIGDSLETSEASGEAAVEFAQKAFAATMDVRMRSTCDALLAIARNVEGYPGRKNLLWLSTAFPIALTSLSDTGPLGVSGVEMIDQDAGKRNYEAEIKRLNAGLSDAKVAVYPINVAGARTTHLFEAENIVPQPWNPLYYLDAARREVQMRGFEQDTMLTVAEGTGGRACTADNDLGECVRLAVDDSSDFYEIAYYPDTPNWNGRYRQIFVKTALDGLNLAYRQGYYATTTDRDDAKVQAAEMQANCDDSLDATAVPFKAIKLPADAPDQLKFGVSIDLPGLTLTGVGNQREVDVAVAVCTLDKKGSPIKLMNYPIHRTLNVRETASLATGGAVSEAIFVPGPKPAAVRLLVMDVASGRLGSIYIKTDDLVAASLTKTSGGGGTQPRQ
jgi:VWFA-related protein